MIADTFVRKNRISVMGVTFASPPPSHRARRPCVCLWLYRSPGAANRPCDAAHKKYECDIKFISLFVSARLRICGFAPHREFRDRFLPCATNTLVKIHQGRRFAQAALKLCGSLEQRRDLENCPTFMSSNAELVACCTSMRRTRQDDRRAGHFILHQ
jgi:hypothetical protein